MLRTISLITIFSIIYTQSYWPFAMALLAPLGNATWTHGKGTGPETSGKRFYSGARAARTFASPSGLSPSPIILVTLTL